MSAQLRIRTLGKVELHLGDELLTDALPAKVAGLVVYLAETGDPQSRSRLAGLMWSDVPEAAARSNLRQGLTRLRRSLPDHVEIHRATVRLRGPVWIDTHELHTAGPSHVVSVYMGDFLAGFEPAGADLFIEWATARRGLHRTTALAALDRAVAEAERDGRLHDGMAAARRILELEPSNEAAHAALMRLFLAAGQPAAALAQFDTCQHYLAEDLGTDPDESTRQLAVKARTSSRASPHARASVAPPATSFVGRERELQRLEELLAAPQCRVVSLVGPGGAGKTRLALELAARLRSGGGEVTVASLAGLVGDNPEHAVDLVVMEIARSLGMKPAERRDPLDFLVDRLAERRLLLVLDNFEHLLAASPVVATMSERLPDLRLLVTSRRRLELGGEWVIELAGLEHPPAGAVGDLTHYPAVALFVDRVRPSPDAPAPANLDAIATICRLVDGLPLAVELAAGRARTIPAHEIARRLRTSIDVLASSAPDVPQRHRSMRSVLDWSWDLLSSDAMRVLAACSVFRGRFDVDAVEAVTGGPALAAIDELVSLSLLSRGDRFSLHELVRTFAAERLRDGTEDEAKIRDRHAYHFADRLRAGWVDDDLEDLLQATDWLLEHAGIGLLREHLRHMWDLQRAMGAHAQARTVLEAALRRPDATPDDRIRWHQCAGSAHLQMGRLAEAQRHHEAALALLGTPLPQGRINMTRALMAQVARQVPHGALPGAGRSRDDARRTTAEIREASFSRLGEVFLMRQQPLGLALAALWALNEGEIAGAHGAVMGSRNEVALVAGITGLHRLARHYAARARQVDVHEIDDEHLAYATMVASVLWLGLGEWTLLAQDGGRGLEAARRSHEPRVEEQILLLLGIGDLVRGRFGDALAYGADVRDRGLRRGSLDVRQWGHLLVAEAAHRLGDHDTAKAQAQAVAAQTQWGLPHGERARVDAILARVAAARGDWDQALAHVRHLDAILRGRPAMLAWGMEFHAAAMEVAVDAISVGGAARNDAVAALDRGRLLLSRYARVFPIARPRLHVLNARAAAACGQPRRARRHAHQALAQAERLAATWEAEQARALVA